MCSKLNKYIVLMFSLLVFSVLPVSAQVISTRAGVVKKVHGEVFYRCRENKKEAMELSNNSVLHDKDTIVTAKSGKCVTKPQSGFLSSNRC